MKTTYREQMEQQALLRRLVLESMRDDLNTLLQVLADAQKPDDIVFDGREFDAALTEFFDHVNDIRLIHRRAELVPADNKERVPMTVPRLTLFNPFK